MSAIPRPKREIRAAPLAIAAAIDYLTPMRPPELFDPDLLALRRARAQRQGPADFLQEAAIAEILDRLAEVNRSFRDPAVVTARPDLWAGPLAARAAPEGDVLALEPEAHDLVVHTFGLHWANDPVGQLVQCRRALRPDGLFLGAMFGGETLRELRAALAEAEAEEAGGISPRIAPMGGIRDLGGLLQRAGFALPVADSLRLEASYADGLALMRDLRAMGETNVMRDRLRRPTPRAVIARAAAILAERFAGPDGRVRATFEIVFLTGWAPAPDQPKPLKPGSATHSLAEALKPRA